MMKGEQKEISYNSSFGIHTSYFLFILNPES
jgi:hypothetical protein